METTNLRIVNSNQIDVESTDLQILNSNEVEVDSTSFSSNFIAITEYNHGYKSVDDDIELQNILFYSAQFHSGKNLESSSNYDVGKKPIEIKYFVVQDSLNLKNSITQEGESSCTFCEICEDVFSLSNIMMWGTNCNHYYCEECIHNYIGKNVDEVIHEVAIRCPTSDCKEILDINLIMSVDFLIRVRDVSRLIKILAFSQFIDCPYMDCMGKLIDDQQGYPIRACPKCWKLFLSIVNIYILE
uniref:RING-type domain-containing protein n=1 Tax=Solanum lycopersicum TaxID=4081 RepID=A0A3Q7J9M0_SOLLC